jgi:DNA-binding NtrC family response regulator
VLCAAAPHAVLAGNAAALLRTDGITLECGSFSSPPAGVDLLVQVVGRGDVAAAAIQQAAFRSAAPPCPVLIAALGLSTDELGALLEGGAADFLRMPSEAEDLPLRVRRILRRDSAGSPAASRRTAVELPGLVGDSPAFTKQLARIPLFAKCDANVLILGDTGTGKEVCAQAIHYLSARSGRPWVAVNCAAIPTELAEAELFGHVRGAFTHAHRDRAGLISEAEGGTLLLDEIDSLSPRAQGKVLRFLQEREYRRLGSDAVLRADVRVIAASNRQLELLCARGEFRQDLLYRLNVLTLRLPPLKARVTDVPQLAACFVRAASRQWQKTPPALSPAVLARLLTHDWPGNVRELKNVMERAVLLCDGDTIGIDDVDLDGAEIAAPPHVAQSFRAAKARVVETFERAYIEQLLTSSRGNVTHAARAAQKNRRAVFELMRKYAIGAERFRPAVDASA